MMFSIRHTLTAGAIAGVLSIGLLSASTETNKPSSSPSKETIDRNLISEAFGHLIGRNLENPGITFDMESIIRGMRNAVAGKPAPMSEENYEKMMAIIQEAAFDELARSNLDDAEKFLTDNAKKSEVKSLESGKVQYMILTEGTGPEVASNSSPLISYRGTYLDGTLFGSSEDAGGPVTLPLDQTIPGFAKGIEGMKEGEKRRIYIHPDLAYGTAGHLPPNSLLTFDVEIVKATELANADSIPELETAELEALWAEDEAIN